ncbi:MAG: hypothetical protein ABI461_09955, partial [Polyangiaceae bacterium]
MKRGAVLIATFVMSAGIFAAKSGAAETGSKAVVAGDAMLRDRCGGVDGGLDKVARVLAARRIDGLAALDQGALTRALRDVGAPYVWPRAWIASAADEKSLALALAKWIDAEKSVGVRRCGVARGRDKNGDLVVAAVAVDALANLEPLAMHSHVGSWLTVDSHVLVPATDARAIIIEPDGTTRHLLASFADGRVLARFAPDRSGIFTVQVVADVDGGPRPVLEARIVVDANAEPTAPADDAAEKACATRAGDPAITCMIQSFRAENRLAPLTRDARLDALARAHAIKMMQSKDLAHDAGDAMLRDRCGGVDGGLDKVARVLA